MLTSGPVISSRNVVPQPRMYAQHFNHRKDPPSLTKLHSPSHISLLRARDAIHDLLRNHESKSGDHHHPPYCTKFTVL